VTIPLTVQADIAGPNLLGMTGVVFTLEAGNPDTVSSVLIQMREGTCASPGDETFRVEVIALPAGSVLTLDGGRRERYVTLSDGSQVSAVPYIAFSGYSDIYDDIYRDDFAVINHPQVCTDETACAKIQSNDPTTVNPDTRGSIATRLMEL